MRLVRCAGCSLNVSATVRTCPNCGWIFSKPVITGKMLAVVGSVIVLAIVVLPPLLNVSTPLPSPKAETKSPEQIAVEAKEKIERAAQQKAKIDCAVRIERALHDPGSVEWLDKHLGVLEPAFMGLVKGSLVIRTNLRAKNGFGAFRQFIAECTYLRKGEAYVFTKMREL